MYIYVYIHIHLIIFTSFDKTTKYLKYSNVYDFSFLYLVDNRQLGQNYVFMKKNATKFGQSCSIT